MSQAAALNMVSLLPKFSDRRLIAEHRKPAFGARPPTISLLDLRPPGHAIATLLAATDDRSSALAGKPKFVDCHCPELKIGAH